MKNITKYGEFEIRNVTFTCYKDNHTADRYIDQYRFPKQKDLLFDEIVILTGIDREKIIQGFKKVINAQQEAILTNKNFTDKDAMSQLNKYFKNL